MTTLKDIATQSGQNLRKLETKAAAHGFTGSVTDELPAGIEAKLTGPKQINSAPSTSEASDRESQQQKQGTDGGTGGVGDIYGASRASTKESQKTRFEMDLAAAEARGRMEAHQIHWHYLGAKNDELRALADGETQAVAIDFEELQIDYLSGLEKARTKELRTLVAENQNSCSVSEMKKKILALNASMKF